MFMPIKNNQPQTDDKKETAEQRNPQCKGDIDDFIFADQPYYGPSER